MVALTIIQSESACCDSCWLCWAVSSWR